MLLVKLRNLRGRKLGIYNEIIECKRNCWIGSVEYCGW